MTTLKKHQTAMLVLLTEVDRICKKHRISYMLFAGTLLGAVRHQGFIPWDDDLDLIMLRPEYERFLEIAPMELDANVYYLQKEFSEHWPMFFSKLRLQNTAAIEKYHPRDRETHQGIYIDIFPLDNLSDNRVLKRLQFAASKIVIAKGLYQRGYETDSLKKKLFLQVCRGMPLRPFLRLTMLPDKQDSTQIHCFLGAASRYEKSIFPRAWFDSVIPMVFAGKSCPVPERYDAILTALYGDYRVLPPPEQRICKVHAVLVDTENSYENYLKHQENMEITTFSRSIR